MPTKIEIRQKYGMEFGDKILKNRFLQGITCRILPNGQIDIPQRDIDNAIRDINGEEVKEWD